MKSKSGNSINEDKLKALYEKAGKPTADMKEQLNKSFGILQQDELKGYDAESYKINAWRK